MKVSFFLPSLHPLTLTHPNQLSLLYCFISSSSSLLSLGDRSYDKRKNAALEIEALIKVFQENSQTDQITAVIQVLSRTFSTSTNANHRKGGLIGIAATAIGLMQNTKVSIEHRTTYVLPTYINSNTRLAPRKLHSLSFTSTPSSPPSSTVSTIPNPASATTPASPSTTSPKSPAPPSSSTSIQFLMGFVVCLRMWMWMLRMERIFWIG